MKFKGFTVTAMTAALVLGMGTAQAEVHDYLRCTLQDGKTLADLEAVTDDFRIAADKAGYGDYKVEVLIPLYSNSVDVIWWFGTSPSVTRVGAIWDWWMTEPSNRDLERRFNEVTSCNLRSLYIVAFTK